MTIPTNVPIPLCDPEGVTRAWACPRCKRVRLGMTTGGPKGREKEAEWSREAAERCGRCRDCGTEIGCNSTFQARCPACEAKETARMEAWQTERRPKWEAAKLAAEAALANALDRDAAIRLRDKMSNISESYYAAGWLVGLEYGLWGMVIGIGPRRFGMGEVTEAEIAELLRLSTKAGGWWRWNEAHNIKVFTPFEEWGTIYAEKVR